MGKRYADFQSMMERYKKEMEQYYTKRMPEPEASPGTGTVGRLTETFAAERQILIDIPGAANALPEMAAAPAAAAPCPAECQPCPPEGSGRQEGETAAGTTIPPPCRPADEGYVIVRAFTGKKAAPVEGADIAVYKESYGKKELMSIQETGEEGITPQIAVKTVKRESTELPGQMMPSATYYINAWAPRYYPIVNRAVDVFGGEVSLVEIEMKPLAEEKPGTPAEVSASG